MRGTRLNETIKTICRTSLGVRPGERFLVFTDDAPLPAAERRALDGIAATFGRAGRELGAYVAEAVIPATGANGAEPHPSLWECAVGGSALAALDAAGLTAGIAGKTVAAETLLCACRRRAVTPHAVAALTVFSTTHTLFRKLLTGLGTRYASMPHIEARMFRGALDVDYDELEAETKTLRNTIAKYSRFLITSPAGTRLEGSFAGRPVLADTGNLRKPGSFGNLPAGEVFFAPLENETNGRLVVEWGARGPLTQPLVAEVRDGRVVSLSGDRRLRRQLEGIFERDGRSRTVAEIGIGTNRRAKRPENVLEAEKIAGTCHVAIGDNTGFGGENSAAVHLDFVVFRPEIRWN